MVPALRDKRPRPAIGINEENPAVAGDLADACQRYPAWRSTQFLGAVRRNGHYQFVVIPAVQSELQRSVRPEMQTPPPLRRNCRSRDSLSVNYCANVARFAEAAKVNRESVRDVHHRRCEFFARDPFTEIKPQRRI